MPLCGHDEVFDHGNTDHLYSSETVQHAIRKINDYGWIADNVSQQLTEESLVANGLHCCCAYCSFKSILSYIAPQMMWKLYFQHSDPSNKQQKFEHLSKKFALKDGHEVCS